MKNGDFENFGKKMPFHETQEYVNDLVERCTEYALSSNQQSKNASIKRLIAYASPGIAAAIAITTILFAVLTPREENNDFNCTVETIANSKSLGTVLSQLSNDQLASLDYCTFDDLPVMETEDEY